MFVVGNQLLGVLFVALALGLTFLMYYLWGFPFDKEKLKSAAPAKLVLLHRLFGWVFVVIYIYLMWDMVPRLWTYQVELPARTVAHLLLGMAIGGILLIKIVIVRFFKHMEAILAPALGTGLLICTLLLLGLALPTTFRESFLRESALQGDAMSTERLARVREQLPKAGVEDADLVEELATVDELLNGRNVLVSKCVQCHDLRTILARPRAPQEWRSTVARMANRATALQPIDEREQLQVTAYLVAISPTLQESVRLQRNDQRGAERTVGALKDVARAANSGEAQLDLDVATETFMSRCSQCHSPVLVQASPPRTTDAVDALVGRMVRNGLRAEADELAQIIGYLNATYVSSSEASTGGAPTQPSIPNPDGSGTTDASRASSPNADAASGNQITVRPAGTELRFEQSQFTIAAGKPVRVVLENPAASGITHNWVLVRDDDAYDSVSTAALSAPDTGFVPSHEAVVGGISAVHPGASGVLELVAPEPGTYRFGCMMPGHSFTMRGELVVTP